MSPAEAVKVLERIREDAFAAERDHRHGATYGSTGAAAVLTGEMRDRQEAIAVAIRALKGG